MNARQASLYMIIAAALWGTHPTLIKLADWSTLGTAWARGLSCAGLLLVYLVYYRLFSLRSLKLQFFCGFFLALNSLLFVAASQYTQAANAVVLMFVFPWITIALDYVFNSRAPTKPELVRLCFGLCGIVLILFGDFSEGGKLGNVFALLAGACIAFHIFFSQKLQVKHGSNHEVLTAMLFAWVLTSVVLLPSLFFGTSLGSGNGIYLLLFCVLSAVPWLLWGRSIAYIPGHVVAALLGVEVLVAALCAYLTLGESLSAPMIAGGAIVLATASLQVYAK
ncbi:MAG: DMT family transporter [Agarilytica sp.]